MRFHRWTKKEVDFLKANYKTVGDKCLAQLMDKKFPRADGAWTNKHIEKKRKYLKLHRSAKQVYRLRVIANVGRDNSKTWDTRGRMKEGDVRVWDGKSYTKFKGKVQPLVRVIAMQQRGLKKIAKGAVVRVLNDTPVIITRAEHARINRLAWRNYSPELKETIKILNQLKTQLYGKEDRGFTRSSF